MTEGVYIRISILICSHIYEVLTHKHCMCFSHCWEALADAYLAKGSYTSSLKCYTICLELSDQTIYPSLQIANIKKVRLKMYVLIVRIKNVLIVSSKPACC